MPKLKKCSFCKKDVSKLFYSNPKCCPSPYCRMFYKQAKSGDNPKDPLKKKVAIKPFSDKKLKEYAEYRILRDEYLKRKPFCEISSPVCISRPVNIHHVRTRKHYLCAVEFFKSACDPCNGYIESHTAWAEENGFKERHLHEKAKK